METTISSIINHLEFLGYTIEKNEPEKKEEKPSYGCAHAIHYNFTFWVIRPEMIMFRIFVTTGAVFMAKTYEYFNDANRRLNITKVYADKDEKEHVVFRFEAIYSGDYKKNVFGTFIEDFHTDTEQLFRQGENHSELLLK